MNIIHEVSDLSQLKGPVALAIGVFDGLHLGHQAVLQAAVDFAERCGGTAAALTFDPHPLSVLRPLQSPRMLCSMKHKLMLMKRFGLSAALVLPFTRETAQTPATEFVEALAKSCLPLGFISVGYEWTFGKGREGNVHRLMELGPQYGFGVHGVPDVKLNGEVVSSTLIRGAVGRGDLALANQLLGREYSLNGTVVQGDNLGDQLGGRTTNIAYGEILIPPDGVYAVRVFGRQSPASGWLGVANFGLWSTMESTDPGIHKVHLLDFVGDLNGQEVEVVIVKKIRDAQPFSSLEFSKAQSAHDVVQARSVLQAVDAAA